MRRWRGIVITMNFYRKEYWQAHIGYSWLVLIIILTVSGNAGAEIIHHQLKVQLLPEQGRISVVDNVQFPATPASAIFTLRSSLAVTATGVELEPLGDTAEGRTRIYRINRLPADRKVQLRYQGSIAAAGNKAAFDMPESVLDDAGVYLDNGSAWLPRFDGYPLATFRLEVEAPGDWEIISQGKRRQQGNTYSFNMPQPQDEIYLLGGLYKRFSMVHDGIEIAIYLYQADEELAQSYLQACKRYLTLYSDWIGPYPYAKFAVVENRWQTGYGMPSFTLLGSRVIRLPFIMYTSLPHEIVHNWWGNGVYLDLSQGNWSEGLTAYMSDHYNDEQKGNDREYRRKALERYANFAAEGRDFALADFSSRHDETSQAVGYSKSMMLFHMLRGHSGDEAFNDNIRQLWQRYRFKHASFPDVVKALYTGSEAGYTAFIEQWLQRPGAPLISLANVDAGRLDDGYSLTFSINQQQQAPAYHLQIPVEVMLEGEQQPKRLQIQLNAKSTAVSLRFTRRPTLLALDPGYDVFRLLHPGERPSSLGRIYGSQKQLLVMPASATAEQAQAWQQLAAAWSSRYGNTELVTDAAIKQTGLPQDAAVWLLGWNNSLLASQQQRFTSAAQRLSGRAVEVNDQVYNASGHAVVLLDADNSRNPMGFIGAEDAATIQLLARKLPHYSSYGVLVFTRQDVRNLYKQSLPVQVSPMTRQLEI